MPREFKITSRNLRPTDRDLRPTGVECRATSVAKSSSGTCGEKSSHKHMFVCQKSDNVICCKDTVQPIIVGTKQTVNQTALSYFVAF